MEEEKPYRKRIADKLLKDRLEETGAVLINSSAIRLSLSAASKTNPPITQ